MFASYKEVFEFIQDLISIPLGASIARAIMSVVSRFAQRIGLEGKSVVVVLDDVYRAIGLDEVDRYTKSLYEWIGYLHERYKASNVAIVLTTSEGMSKRILSKHTYVSIYMMWNLPKKSFEEFVEQLNPHIDAEAIWMHTGGNPRATIDLARHGWSIDKWLSKIYEDRIRRAVHIIGRDKILQLAENPDFDWAIAEKLEELNLMIELRRSSAISQIPKKDLDLGIGEEWAWQIPAYRYAITRFAKS
ncbi:MAG: ATP-binding protein [Ignisphaera sp.]